MATAVAENGNERMRNKDLPKLLRAIANSEQAKQNKHTLIFNKHTLIFNEAANNLEKLDIIEIILDSVAASKQSIKDIINA